MTVRTSADIFLRRGAETFAALPLTFRLRMTLGELPVKRQEIDSANARKLTASLALSVRVT